jgi:Tfp pilus assembly protein PilO
MIPPLPWKLIGRIAVPVLVLALTFATGWNVANWRRDSLELAVVEAADRAATASRASAVKAIGEIEVRNVTIRQRAETVVREVPVYTECRHDPRGLQTVNSALAEPGSDRGIVPAADPAD